MSGNRNGSRHQVQTPFLLVVNFLYWFRYTLSLGEIGKLRFGGLYETTYTISLRDGSRSGIYLADGC